MIDIFRRVFPYHRFKYSNKAIQTLVISDTMFYSGMALVDIIFSVFIVETIPGATVVSLGIGHALFMMGIVIFEPIIAHYYDKASHPSTVFYGLVFGNLLKSAFRLVFIFISSVNMFYVVFLTLGVIHSIEYPAFSKIFTQNLDKGYESTEWSFKDLFVSFGKVVTMFLSGYIALYFGYNFLFVLSAVIMFLSGVVFPLLNKKEFVK
ncbi:MAG: MFS transporter [Patescibacteria group bacterium]